MPPRSIARAVALLLPVSPALPATTAPTSTLLRLAPNGCMGSPLKQVRPDRGPTARTTTYTPRVRVPYGRIPVTAQWRVTTSPLAPTGRRRRTDRSSRRRPRRRARRARCPRAGRRAAAAPRPRLGPPTVRSAGPLAATPSRSAPSAPGPEPTVTTSPIAAAAPDRVFHLAGRGGFDIEALGWEAAIALTQPAEPEVPPLTTEAALFDHLLVDEYQDTNHLQSKIVRLLAATRASSGTIATIAFAVARRRSGSWCSQSETTGLR